MFGIKAKITKCIDDSGHPSFVECEFIDVHKVTQVFRDKDAIFTIEILDKSSKYPIDGIIGCEILEKKMIDGREIVKVTTEKPWGVESKKGETVFEVSLEQIIEFEHS